MQAKSFALNELFVRVRKDELYGRTYQRQTLRTLPSVGRVLIYGPAFCYCACSGCRGGMPFGGGAITRLTLAIVRPTASDA